MNKPNFYCLNYINTHNNIKKYQKPECKKQCDKCINIIIEFHRNKKGPFS